MIYSLIVFLPLIGALIAGLFGRLIGPRPSEIVTTSLLAVSALLSWTLHSSGNERRGLPPPR